MNAILLGAAMGALAGWAYEKVKRMKADALARQETAAAAKPADPAPTPTPDAVAQTVEKGAPDA